MNDLQNRSATPLLAELATLRARVAGVTGCVIAGVDGLVILDDLPDGGDAYNVAALAAAAAGVGRQVGLALRQGEQLLDCAIHNTSGYFTIYGVGESALLAVLGDANLNVALLHLETKGTLPKVADLLRQAALSPRDRPTVAAAGGLPQRGFSS